ncbi:hypothetical protein ACHAQA_002533 [Verticillium albo-atrum]
MLATTAAVAIAVVASLPGTAAKYKIDTRDDVLKTAKTLAQDLVVLYQGTEAGGALGLLDEMSVSNSYHPGHAATFADTLISYWRVTGDETHNDLVVEDMARFAGEDGNFLSADFANITANSDRGYWAMAAMSAVEYDFPPPPDGRPSWLDVARNTFDDLAQVIEDAKGRGACDGGLPWWHKLYMNSEAMGAFFNLAARLARYTGNETYAEHANDAWDWLLRVLVDGETWAVYDGTQASNNCTMINKVQFSAGAGLLIQGAAFMYNLTNGADIWRERTENLTEATLNHFFPKNVAFEPACEALHICPPDALAMKGQVHRWLSVATQIAPSTAGTILPVLRKSAQAAVDQCVGGKLRRQCGFYWSEADFTDPIEDGSGGTLEQMSVLAAAQSVLVPESLAPGTRSNDQNVEDGQAGQNNDSSSSQTATGSAESTPSTPAATPESRAMWGKKYDPFPALLVMAGLAWMLAY